MSNTVEPHPMELYAVSFYEHAFYGPKLHQIDVIASTKPFMAFSVGDYLSPDSLVPSDSVKPGEVWKITKILHRIGAFSGKDIAPRHVSHEVCLLVSRELHPS